MSIYFNRIKTIKRNSNRSWSIYDLCSDRW